MDVLFMEKPPNPESSSYNISMGFFALLLTWYLAYLRYNLIKPRGI